MAAAIDTSGFSEDRFWALIEREMKLVIAFPGTSQYEEG